MQSERVKSYLNHLCGDYIIFLLSADVLLKCDYYNALIYNTSADSLSPNINATRRNRKMPFKQNMYRNSIVILCKFCVNACKNFAAVYVKIIQTINFYQFWSLAQNYLKLGRSKGTMGKYLHSFDVKICKYSQVLLGWNRGQ